MSRIVTPSSGEPRLISSESTFQDDLIRGFLAGDSRAVSAIDGWISVVLRTEFRRLHEEWEDLRQEVRIRVFGNLRAGRFSGASGLRTYVHRIAKNVAIDAWRKASRRAPSRTRRGGTVSNGEHLDGYEEDLMSRDLLAKILAGLTPDERRLLERVHGQHLSYAEIARAEGIAEGTVKARVFRCRQRLLARRTRLTRARNA